METMKLWPGLETATIVKKKIIAVLHQIFNMHSRCCVIFIFLVSLSWFNPHPHVKTSKVISQFKTNHLPQIQ